jgi:hypothetical protein
MPFIPDESLEVREAAVLSRAAAAAAAAAAWAAKTPGLSFLMIESWKFFGDRHESEDLC